MHLYVLENNTLIWPNKPKYNVVIADRTNKNKKFTKILDVGVPITSAFAFFCEYNKFYVLPTYRVNSKAKLLETRLVHDSNVNTGIYEV